MRWRKISRENVKERFGDGMVMLFLWLAFLVTGCDVPGRSDRDASRAVTDPSPPVAAAPARTVAFETYVEGEPDPEPPVLPERVTYDEAEALFREGRYGEAADYFTVYIRERPDNPWGHYMLGLSAWRGDRPDEAIEAFERAIALDPSHGKSLLNLGRVLLGTDRPDEALTRIEEALALDPASVDGFRLLGLARHALGWPDAAEDAFYQALVLDENDAWSMNNLGLVRIQREAFEEAVPPLARAVELRPDVAVFQNNLGIALERLGYFGAASDAYRAALKSDPAHHRAEANLTRVVDRPDPDGLPPLDLVGWADRFLEEVRSDLDIPEPDTLVQPVTIPEPDTTIAPADTSVSVPDTLPAVPVDSGSADVRGAGRQEGGTR